MAERRSRCSTRSSLNRPWHSQCNSRFRFVNAAILVIAAELLLTQGVLAIGNPFQTQKADLVKPGPQDSPEAGQEGAGTSAFRKHDATEPQLQEEKKTSQAELQQGQFRVRLKYPTSPPAVSGEVMKPKQHGRDQVLSLPSARDAEQLAWTWGFKGSLSILDALSNMEGSRGRRRRRVGGRKVTLPGELGDGEEFLDLLVHHASAIYLEDLVALAAWNCSRCTIEPVSQFHLTSLIIDTEAMLEAYVGVHHDKQMVVVCFRGTHNTYIKNWIDDLWALELDMNFPGVDHALVHRGFYYAYHKSTLKPRISEEVLRLLAANPSYPVAITGHSLGAALASFCGLDLVLSFNVPQERVWLATFGSPRVGNPVFADYFKKKLPYSVRVTHGRDIVVHLPPHTPYSGLLAYHHVAQEIWYHRTSFFSTEEVSQTCDDSGEDLTCSRSVPGSSISDHLTYLGVSLRNES